MVQILYKVLSKHELSIFLLSAGKAFDITYVRLKFHTSRPESFAIYKRTYEGGPWVPYQYYSGSCEKTYRKESSGFIRTGEDEQQALCTADFSDISPLTGGNVAFSTLEGRPSAYNFDHSPVLQVSSAGHPHTLRINRKWWRCFLWAAVCVSVTMNVHIKTKRLGQEQSRSEAQGVWYCWLLFGFFWIRRRIF